MELDELKNKWKQLDEHIKVQDVKIKELTDQIMQGKVKSPLETLKRHCIISAILVPFLLPFFFFAYDFVGLNCPNWQKILLHTLTIVFVVFTFLRELWFIYDLKHINISKKSAVESLKQAIKFRKHYHWGVTIDIIIGLIFIIVIMYSFNNELILGGIIGLIIGSIIGYKMYRYYIHTIDELETALLEWSEDMI